MEQPHAGAPLAQPADAPGHGDDPEGHPAPLPQMAPGKAEAFYSGLQDIELTKMLTEPNCNDNSLGLEAGDLVWLQNKVKNDLHKTVRFLKTREARDTHHTGDSFQQFLDSHHKFCQSLVTIAILGGGFTFTVIFANIAPPRAGHTVERVKQTLGIAWLMFTTALVWATFLAIMVSGSTEEILVVPWYQRGYAEHLIAISALLVGALLAVAEALRLYVRAVGLAALVLIGAMVSLFVASLFGQRRLRLRQEKTGSRARLQPPRL